LYEERSRYLPASSEESTAPVQDWSPRLPMARKSVVRRWPARRTVDLANRAEVIRQVCRTRDDTIHFDLIHRARSCKRILPSARDQDGKLLARKLQGADINRSRGCVMKRVVFLTFESLKIEV
jgi:hypothetical protein